jgi:hypothetical protein
MKITAAQSEVLWRMVAGERLSRARGVSTAGPHFFFNGSTGTVHLNTANALEQRGYIRRLPKAEGQPFWRADFEITAEGRKALES